MFINSIFSLTNTRRVSFKTDNGSFAYRGLGYAYIIRPTTDGASATLRITKSLLTKFLKAYWPKNQHPNLKDMALTQSGFGWWRVHSLSEVGDSSVHRFFRYLNMWVLARNKAAELAHQVSQHVKRRYTLLVEQVGHAMRVSPPQVPSPQVQATQPAPVNPSRLEQLARVVNAKFGHVSN